MSGLLPIYHINYFLISSENYFFSVHNLLKSLNLDFMYNGLYMLHDICSVLQMICLPK